jgi:hypothetical protein
MDHVARIVSGRLSHKADMLKAYLDVRFRGQADIAMSMGVPDCQPNRHGRA